MYVQNVRSGSSSRFFLPSFCDRRARLEAETVVAGFDDVTMMGQAIEERRRHFGVAKNSGPFAEAQVCGDDDTGALIEFAEQVKEQGPRQTR